MRVNYTLMRRKIFKGVIARCLLIALILAVCLIAVGPSPVFAYSFERYLDIDYDIGLSRTSISGGEPFYATLGGGVTCKKNLPVRVTEGYMISSVVAEHQEDHIVVTLNQSYRVDIEPFPSRVGEGTQFNEHVPLVFPSESEPGIYNLEAKLIKAEIDTSFGWIEVTSGLPTSEVVGTVKYEPVESESPVTGVVEPVETPATFAVDNLSIAPSEVDAGEEATISILVTNTSNLSGSYDVVLKIDGVAVATEEITLEGGASKTVPFTTTQDVAGTYSISVDDLSGTLEVKLVPKVTTGQLIGIIAGSTAAVVVALIIRRRQRSRV